MKIYLTDNGQSYKGWFNGIHFNVAYSKLLRFLVWSKKSHAEVEFINA